MQCYKEIGYCVVFTLAISYVAHHSVQSTSNNKAPTKMFCSLPKISVEVFVSCACVIKMPLMPSLWIWKYATSSLMHVPPWGENVEHAIFHTIYMSTSSKYIIGRKTFLISMNYNNEDKTHGGVEMSWLYTYAKLIELVMTEDDTVWIMWHKIWGSCLIMNTRLLRSNRIIGNHFYWNMRAIKQYASFRFTRV